MPAPVPPTAAFGAADVAFATGMLRLESQAQAMAGLAAGRATSPGLRQFAGSLRRHGSQSRQMAALMSQWHQPTPAPFAPGALPPAGMGNGMMGAHSWREMMREHGSEFSDHWLDLMIANRGAEIALCRRELQSGRSPQARNLARIMLSQRQAELTQMRRMHHDREGNGDHD
jgi:uncharacterized protein (DUF305 family)